jgi:hypothetical protein
MFNNNNNDIRLAVGQQRHYNPKVISILLLVLRNDARWRVLFDDNSLYNRSHDRREEFSE